MIVILSPTVKLCCSCVLTVAVTPVALISSRTTLGGLKLIAKLVWIPLPDWYLKYLRVCLHILLLGLVPAVISTPPSNGLCNWNPSGLSASWVAK